MAKKHFNNIKIPKGYDKVEIMIHPGILEIDKENINEVWDKNILSPYRSIELETLLDKDIINRIN